MSPNEKRAKMRRVAGVAVMLAVLAWGLTLAQQTPRLKAQKRLDAGMEYARIGQAGEAERAWQEAARLAPDNPVVWELLGELYLNTEQWGKGLQAFQQLQRVAPNKPALYARLAACALRSGDEQQAQTYAREQLKRDPEDSASLAILAFLSDMQEDPDRQIEYLQRLLRRAPDDPEFLEMLAQAYSKKAKYAEMLPVLEKLISRKPDGAFGYAMRGVARLETDSSPAVLAQAEADLLKALEINALYPFGRYSLGRVYAREGRYDKAVFQLELAQKLSPHEMPIAFELAAAYARAHKPALAAQERQRFETLRQEATQVSVLQKRCALEKTDFQSHLQLGRLTMERGDLRQASYYLGRAVALRPDSPDARNAYHEMALRIRGDAQTSAAFAKTMTPRPYERPQ